MNTKLERRFDELPTFVRSFYERKLIKEEILSIHRGWDRKQLKQWIQVILMDGTKDHWTTFLWGRWEVQSIRLRKSQPKVKEHRREIIINQCPRNMKCRLCGEEIDKKVFVRIFLLDWKVWAAICLHHELTPALKNEVWLRRRAPQPKIAKRVTKSTFSRLLRKQQEREKFLPRGRG